jgi:hypothetical protein
VSVDFSTAEGWRPNPGDVAEGKVTEISEYDGGYGSYPVVTIETDEGKVALHAFHTVLRNELARLNVQVGEPLAVLYAGNSRRRTAQAPTTATRSGCRGARRSASTGATTRMTT